MASGSWYLVFLCLLIHKYSLCLRLSAPNLQCYTVVYSLPSTILCVCWFLNVLCKIASTLNLRCRTTTVFCCVFLDFVERHTSALKNRGATECLESHSISIPHRLVEVARDSCLFLCECFVYLPSAEEQRVCCEVEWKKALIRARGGRPRKWAPCWEQPLDTRNEAGCSHTYSRSQMQIANVTNFADVLKTRDIVVSDVSPVWLDDTKRRYQTWKVICYWTFSIFILSVKTTTRSPWKPVGISC